MTSEIACIWAVALASLCLDSACRKVERTAAVGDDANCGSYASTETCTSRGSREVTTTLSLACVPETCQSLGVECGGASDGCGGSLSCGDCGSGESCSSGICVQDPGISPPSGGTNRPGAHNTGPSNPGVLKSLGSTTITTDGTVLENFDMKGRLYIEANDVTVRNFRINAGTHYGIWVKPGYSNILIEDGEIYNATSALLYTQSPTTARRLYLHYAAADGMKIESNNTLIEYCFMEDIGVLALDPEAHADGNQTRGGSNVTFRYNNFDMPKGISGIDPNRIHMLHDTSDGKSNSDFSNFVVEHNWMNGGNYTVTCLPGVVYRDNFFGRDYNYGVRAGGGCAWTNNRWDDTGNLIP